MKNVLLSSRSTAFDGGLGFVRIIVGIFLIYHGWEIFDAGKMNEYGSWEAVKHVGKPATLVYLGKGAELIGGCLLALGCLTRVAAIIIILTMGYVAFFIGHGKVWFEDQHPFMFVLVALIFFFTGPGKWSLDYVFFDKKRW